MDDKHILQTALPDNIRHLYQQILSQGYIGDNLTLQITQGRFPDREPEPQPELHRSREQEQDIEPER